MLCKSGCEIQISPHSPPDVCQPLSTNCKLYISQTALVCLLALKMENNTDKMVGILKMSKLTKMFSRIFSDKTVDFLAKCF